MKKRLAAFFSAHAWKVSFTLRRFLLHWISSFAVIWTFVDFAIFFFGGGKAITWKPAVWLILAAGLLTAAWMSRPRLTRAIRLQDRDVTIRLTVDDLFRRRGDTAIIPINTSFKHDHVDEGAVVVQLRDKLYPDAAAFDRGWQTGLGHVPGSKYPLGTVVRLEAPTPKAPIRAAYLVATTELNEYGRAVPDRSHVQRGLQSLWTYIAQRGRKEPLVIPIVGSGRHRLTANRMELLDDIVKSFLIAVRDSKFTERLTVVIHPDAFRRNGYSLDEMEECVRFRCRLDA